jgi:hypothetical protein
MMKWRADDTWIAGQSNIANARRLFQAPANSC